MLPWQQKKVLNLTDKQKEITTIIRWVVIAHLCTLLILLVIGSSKPALLITYGSGTKNTFRADFITNLPAAKNGLPIATHPVALQKLAPQKNVSKKVPAQPVVTQPVHKKPLKKEAPQQETIVKKIIVPLTKETPKKKEKEIQKEPAQPVKEKLHLEEKKKEPAQAQATAAITDKQKEIDTPDRSTIDMDTINMGTIEMGTINQTGPHTDTLQDAGGSGKSTALGTVIAEQWYRVKGMPSDFYCELTFTINRLGKASEITIVRSHNSRLYQAHAQESLMRCQFDTRYYTKKCRIILKA